MDFHVDKRPVIVAPECFLVHAGALFFSVIAMIMLAVVAFLGAGVEADRKTPGDVGVEFDRLHTTGLQHNYSVITVKMQGHMFAGRKPENDPVTLMNPDGVAVSIAVTEVQVESLLFARLHRPGHFAQQ
jgi:hypothetical protein